MIVDKVADAPVMLVFPSIVADLCRGRRRFGSGMTIAGMLLTMLSRCVRFVTGAVLGHGHARCGPSWPRQY